MPALSPMEMMESPISLPSGRKLWAFYGKIQHGRLKSVFKVWDELVLGAAEVLLGEEFMCTAERWQTNANIAARFLAVLLDLEVPRAMVMFIARKLVWDNLLEGAMDVIIIAVLGVGVLHPRDLPRALVPGERVELYPFILDITGEELWRHRERARCRLIFLKHYLYLEPSGGVDWRCLFRDFLVADGVLRVD